MSTDPIEPSYILPSVGQPLVAYEGPARMANGDDLTLRIWSPLVHSADLLWTANGQHEWASVSRKRRSSMGHMRA